MEECPHDEQRVLQLVVDEERSVWASSNSGQYVVRKGGQDEWTSHCFLRPHEDFKYIIS